MYNLQVIWLPVFVSAVLIVSVIINWWIVLLIWMVSNTKCLTVLADRNLFLTIERTGFDEWRRTLQSMKSLSYTLFPVVICKRLTFVIVMKQLPITSFKPVCFFIMNVYPMALNLTLQKSFLKVCQFCP